ncbi:MAG: GGDEF domain-containing protein [Acidimicrobiales bacterium]|nr:GGDEF domain-containing protein [Acidimicrobiales bacterium]
MAIEPNQKIQRALENVLEFPDTIDVHFQPLVGFDSKRIIGAESLLRVSVDDELVPPGELVEAAMAAGHERDLGRAVLNEVCRRKSEWPDGLLATVNVAPNELNAPNFASDSKAIMERWDVDPTEVVFEVTEDWVTPDDQLIENMQQVLKIGSEIALDDFGTGYSSLSHLRSLPLTAVKLDRTFVERVDQPGPDAEIARSIIHMSHALGHRVVAEGVETVEQYRALESFGCDRWQGYLCSPAVDPDSFAGLVETYNIATLSSRLRINDVADDEGDVTEALDSFVFRRTSSTRWAHVGGRNQGEGWAGIIEVDEDEAPILDDALNQGLVRADWPTPRWLLGPYHPCSAAVVALDGDTVVLFGSTEPDILPDLDHEEWLGHGSRLAADIGSVSPAKMLADELEQAEALQAMMSGSSMTIGTTMRHVADTVATALSCEFGVVYLETLDEIVTTTATPRVFDLELIKAELRTLRSELVAQKCVQDSEAEALPLTVAGQDFDVRSWLAIPTAPAFGGIIVCAHTSRNPRGFTTLCQRLGGRLAEAANLILETAAEREALHTQALRANAEARRDPLTGLANRLAWDEALNSCGDRNATAVIIDLDGLKNANDLLGHAAGDRLLVGMANALERASRSSDTVARIGGDEFGVLLYDAPKRAGNEFVERALSAALSEIEFSHGVAQRAEGETVRETVHRADTAMYKNKRFRQVLKTASSQSP